MPGPNGYQICEMLRSNEATRDLPVVLLVGSFEPFDENEAARVGANAFLTKPFQSIRQLVSQVSELIQSRAEPDIAEEPTAAFSEPPTDTEERYEEASFDRSTPVSEEVVPPVRDTTDIESLYHQSLGAEPGT
jgi:DNA-binding response OmpR family regulator